jgi:hypothetical protein
LEIERDWHGVGLSVILREVRLPTPLDHEDGRDDARTSCRAVCGLASHPPGEREATVVDVLATTTEQLAPARTNSAHRVHVCVHVGEEY